MGDVKRSVLLSLGWLLAGALLFLCLILIDFAWSFLSFNPRLDPLSSLALSGIVASLVGCGRLAKATKDHPSLIVSLITCLLLLVLGATGFPRELIAFLLEGNPVPDVLWFRSGLALVALLPLIFWLRWSFDPWWQGKVSEAP